MTRSDQAHERTIPEPKARGSADMPFQAGRRVRVLQIVESMDVGGMERMVATLCRALDPRDFEARVLVTRKRGLLGEVLAAEGIPVSCAEMRSDRADWRAPIRVAHFIRQYKPDVVHTHATHSLLYGGIPARWCNVPLLVHTEHGRVFPDKPHLMLAERWFSASLVKFVTVSQALADEVQRYERIPSHRLSVIPNGVADLPPRHSESCERLRDQLIGSRPGPVVGVMARLVWEKGLDVLLHAWAKRLAQGEVRGTLVIAGEGPERSNLEGLAKSLGVSDSIRLPGTVTDIGSFYRLLDAFVLSSVSEGLPMALLEAMAAGIPIIATRVGAVPEALDFGAAGVLIDPSDQASLATQIDAFVMAFAERNSSAECATVWGQWVERGIAARRRFETAYTAGAMVAEYRKLYRPATTSHAK